MTKVKRMKTGYNTRLRQNAENSALYGTAAMLFLCDSDFHVCMKSFGAERGIKRPIIGADITTRMDGDLTASFAKAGLDGVKGQIFLDTELYDVIVYSGRLYKDNYIVLLLDEGINILPEYTEYDVCKIGLARLQRKLGELIDELLHTPRQAGSLKLDHSCMRMIRIKRHIYTVLYNSRTDGALDGDEISVNALLNIISKACEKALPAYGCRVNFELEPAAHYCKCRHKHFSLFVCGLIFSLLGLAENHVVSLNSHAADNYINLSFRFYTKRDELVMVASLDDLVQYMSKHADLFLIELMLSAQIAKELGWDADLKYDDGRFYVNIRIPEVHAEHMRLQLRENGAEDDYIRHLISDFCQDLPDYILDDSNIL